MRALPGLVVAAIGTVGYVAVRLFNWHPDPQDIAAWMFLTMLVAGSAAALGALR